MSSGTGAVCSIPDESVSAGALRNTLVALVIEPVDADTLSQSISKSILEARKGTCERVSIEIKPRVAGTKTCRVYEGVCRASRADIVDSTKRGWADAGTITHDEVLPALNRTLLDTLGCCVRVCEARDALALGVNDKCIGATGDIANTVDSDEVIVADAARPIKEFIGPTVGWGYTLAVTDDFS